MSHALFSKLIRPSLLVAAAAGLVPAASTAAQLSVEWQAEVATAEYDWIMDVAVSTSGESYAVGYLTDPLSTGPGEINAGHYDGVVIKYAADGTKLWHRYIQTSQRDRAEAVAVDPQGNVLVAGYTAGDLGGFGAGMDDFFVAKYNAAGTRLWVHQFGSIFLDHLVGVTTDAQGNVYATGYTRDGNRFLCNCETDLVIVKYDPDGNQLWYRKHGTDEFDNGRDILVDPDGFIYIAGDTRGDFGGETNTNNFANHAMISKFDQNGDIVWTNIFGSDEQDIAWAIARSQDNNIYATGVTNGRIDGGTYYSIGENDGFLARFDATTGATNWIKQIEPTSALSSEGMWGVAVDSQGVVHVAGYVGGTFFGTPSGPQDAALATYDDAGNLLSSQLFGTSGLRTDAFSLKVDDNDNVYLTGNVGTADGLGHDFDAWVMKLSAQNDCPADTNDDGSVTPADFGAWITAFNTQSAACDQNDDSLCTPADFGAWITNFNAGC